MGVLLPVLLPYAAVVGDGVLHGRAKRWYGCGANTGVFLMVAATGSAAAAAAVGMQIGGGSSTITAAARAAPAVAMLLQLAAVVLGSDATSLSFAAMTGATQLRLSTVSLLARVAAGALRQPGEAL
jgi:hypothetical protein